MIVGIGTDLIEIERVAKACKKHAFVMRCFSFQEQNIIKEHPQTAAGNFAVKEAVSKTFGTGMSGFELTDIEVLRDERGKPYVNLYGNAKRIADGLGITRIEVSISNTKDYATAYAVAEGDYHIAGGTHMVQDIFPKESADSDHISKVDMELLKEGMPIRLKSANKGRCGHVLLVVGSVGMSGAAYLSASAAYEMGAGLVRILTVRENRTILQQMLPEAIVDSYEEFDPRQIESLLKWCDIVGIGCGLGQDYLQKQLLYYVLEHSTKPMVIDADGLNLLSQNLSLLNHIQAQCILTPHMKEMSRLLHCDLSELQENRLHLIETFTKRYNVICVCKDAETVVMSGSEQYINTTGNEAMAKGGSGDVLMGMISGLVGQEPKGMFKAARTAVCLHGLCGDAAREKRGIYSVKARDIIDEIHNVLKQI